MTEAVQGDVGEVMADATGELADALETPDAARGLVPQGAAELAAPLSSPTERNAALNVGEHATHSLAIPNLEVIHISWDGDDLLAGLRIDQRLPTGDTLRLRYVGMLGAEDTQFPTSTDDAAALRALTARIRRAVLPMGWEQVIDKPGDHWVVASGPLPEAQIRAYLMTLR